MTDVISPTIFTHFIATIQPFPCLAQPGLVYPLAVMVMASLYFLPARLLDTDLLLKEKMNRGLRTWAPYSLMIVCKSPCESYLTEPMY